MIVTWLYQRALPVAHSRPNDKQWSVYYSKYWCYRYTFRKGGGQLPWLNWIEVPSMNRGDGIAIRKDSFASGTERVVFNCREFVVVGDYLTFVGPQMVAKETRFVEDERKKIEFHEVFCETQATAKDIADAFNERVRALSRNRYSSESPPPFQQNHFIFAPL